MKDDAVAVSGTSAASAPMKRAQDRRNHGNSCTAGGESGDYAEFHAGRFIEASD
jgi:hypothetical protein